VGLAGPIPVEEGPLDAERALRFLRVVNALEAVDRAGYVLRGVERPECVAAHSLGVLAAALAVAEMVPEPVDRGRLALLALLHDLGESRVGDVPMPEKTARHDEEEARAMDAILDGLPRRFRAAWEELREGRTIEARLVKGCDKLQLMAKVLDYEREGRGELAEFWENERNFRDGGVPEIRAVYDAIRDDGRTNGLRRQARLSGRWRARRSDPDDRPLRTDYGGRHASPVAGAPGEAILPPPSVLRPSSTGRTDYGGRHASPVAGAPGEAILPPPSVLRPSSTGRTAASRPPPRS
jgi:putative hydrolase of HD superfamily